MEIWYSSIILLVTMLIPLVGIIAFARWIMRQQAYKFEEKAKAWEVFISLLSTITALVGGACLIVKYVDDQSHQQTESRKQAVKELNFKNAAIIQEEIARLQKQKDQVRPLYDQVMLLAVHLARLDEKEGVSQVKKSREREQFEEFYWAKLIGIESQDVEGAMVQLRKQFEAWAAKGVRPAEIDQKVLDLSRSCAEHIRLLDTKIAERNAQSAPLTTIGK